MDTRKRENKTIRLLKKGRRGVAHAVFSRTGLITALLLLQFGFLLAVFFWLREWHIQVLGGTVALTAVMVLHILNTDMDPTAKITWLLTIMAMPVFGSLFYVYTRRDVGHRLLKAVMLEREKQTRTSLRQSREVSQRLRAQAPGAAAMTRYVRRIGCHPVWDKTAVTYFPSGEAKFQRLLEELEAAEKFIFLEYFIVDEGVMWGQILEILARKARQGVDVRVMYDGTCEFTLLPRNYPRRLEELGIRCHVFAPVEPFISTHYNYRDHRKIAVIDGHTAFNGGVNLADEYINQVEKFGHWKDTAILLQGPAVRTFTLLFLQMWGEDPKGEAFSAYLNAPVPEWDVPGFVMPYGDSPLDHHRVGEQVYIDLLSRAQRYVHIMTPYLILDSRMEGALKYAARRGVDVRILLPGIPDKASPYALAKTHFASLLEAGVKIYTYTPGFLHAKSFVCDDTEAVVGTINLDYRSLYHHFECATWFSGMDAVLDVEADFQRTMAACARVTRDSIRAEKWHVRLTGKLLKTIAPLL